MGFRSTLISADCAIEWPAWFRKKYARILSFSPSGVLSTPTEVKHYSEAALHLAPDIQRAIDWSNADSFFFVFLHECGGVSRCVITENTISWTEPKDWGEVDEVQHWYCYDCLKP